MECWGTKPGLLLLEHGGGEWIRDILQVKSGSQNPTWMGHFKNSQIRRLTFFKKIRAHQRQCDHICVWKYRMNMSELT